MSVWYATREDLVRELDVKPTARNNRAVDRALEGASRSIEEPLCHRRFYPTLATRYFDWPNSQTSRPWRLWLDDQELISITTLSSGGTTITAADYFLEPVNHGPPYNRLEIDLDSSAAFGGGATPQRDITITGLWGYRNDETQVGTVAEALDATETAVDVDADTSAAVGVGNLLRIDSERMIVTGRSMLDTGQNLGGAGLTAQNNNVTVSVADGTAFEVDETILIDSERMLIVDIAGNNLTVERAWDGSNLAAHTAGADIYAPRTLTVQRGALGTTAATHTTGTSLYRWDPPGPVRDLAIAEAINTVLQTQSGYLRTVRGSGSSTREAGLDALMDLRERVRNGYGRKARHRGV